MALREAVRLYRKATAGSSPEAWEQVGAARLTTIWPLGPTAALTEDTRFRTNATHAARAMWDAEYGLLDADTHRGRRLLVREGDGANFLIQRIVETGRRLPGGRYRYMLLYLSHLQNPEVAL